MGWTPHGDFEHRMLRRILLRSACQQLERLRDIKEWEAGLAAEDLIGFRWRNGVYPGWQSEERWEIPREWWEGSFDDTGGQEFVLSVMREYLTGQLKAKHGLVVNQATWFYRVYNRLPLAES